MRPLHLVLIFGLGCQTESDPAPADCEPSSEGGAATSSPFDAMEGDWSFTITWPGAAEDGSDMTVSGQESCQRIGPTGFSCLSSSMEGDPWVVFSWYLEPESLETYGTYVHFLDDAFETRTGQWDPTARTWSEQSKGASGVHHAVHDLSQTDPRTTQVYADAQGEPGVLIASVEHSR